MLTAFGILVLPICLACSLSPELLLCVVIYTGGFEAAASLVLGSFGVQPNIPPTLLFMGHLLVLRMMGSRFRGNAEVVRAMAPLLIFIACVLVGAVILPHLFAEGVSIWPQKSDEHAQVPLTFSAANITQSAYMILDIAFVWCCATYIASFPVRTRRLVSAYFGCALLVVGIAVWQFASRVAGIPFPNDFFYSNPGWLVYPDQAIGSVPRTNGPFSEPAALAAFLCGPTYASAWLLMHGRGSRLVKWTLAASVFGMVLSTSTTGFVILFIGAGLAGLYVLTKAKPRVARRFRQVAIPVVVAGFFVVVSTPILFPSIADAVGNVITQTLSKSDSDSYEERTQADNDSMALVLSTYGLGVGWGSNRSSSLIPGVLGNAGVPGAILILWTLASIRKEIRIMRDFIQNSDDQWALQGAAAGLLGFFLASLVAGPTITSMTFYELLGITYGVLARARLVTNELRRTAIRQQHALLMTRAG